MPNNPKKHTTKRKRTPSPPPPPPRPAQFPTGLRAYVKRAIEACASGEFAEVEAELKRVITEAVEGRVVWSLEWDRMPLPQVELARRRIEGGV